MKYLKTGDSYSLEQYTGEESIVTIPAFKDDASISGIAPKAFLSCKTIRELVLPETLTEIGDWAFAHMKNLKKLTLPGNFIHFGKNVFLDCEQLTQLCVLPDNSDNPGTAFFLASAVTLLNNLSLCRPELAGSKTEHQKWISAYDSALMQFISASDEAGFEPVYYGWFSVDDIDLQKQTYTAKRQREKTFLTFQRLLYPKYLNNDAKELLCSYLTDHMPGGTLASQHTIPFTMLCEDYNNDVRYLSLLADIGYITSETFPALRDGLRNASPEIMGFLLRHQQTLQDSQDFFAGLAL